jgi:hypothetical protein
MKKSLLSIFLFSTAIQLLSQVYVLDENFDSLTVPELPQGWTTTTNFDIGFRTEDGNNSDYTNASGLNNVVIRNTDSTGTYTFYSPVFSTVGLIDVQLMWASRVSTNFLASGSTTPMLEYSVNGGVSWEALSYTESEGSSIWGLVNGGTPILLPADAYQNPNVQLRWTVNILTDPNGSYRIDDVRVWGAENPYVNLRLLVNMLFQPIGGEDIYTAGDFNGWDTGSAVMTDIGGSIYEYVVPVLRNSEVKFRFYNGSTIGSEVVPDTCGIDDGQGLGLARYINIGMNDTVFGPVCFGECDNCVIVEPVFVQFSAQVDMSQQVVSPDGVYIVGNFGDGTTEQVVAMTAEAGNIYTTSVEMLEGTTLNYRFQNGPTAAGLEIVPPSCGVANASNEFLREAFIGSDNSAADTVCFSECAACVVQSVEENNRSLDLWPNPASDCVYVQLPANCLGGSVEVYSADGRLVRNLSALSTLTQLNIQEFYSGFYFIVAQHNGLIYRNTLVVNNSLICD